MTPEIAVLEHLARQVPPLPGARCKGRSADFDLEDRDDPRVASAVETCRRCPALIACRRWLATLSRYERPAGVVAGRLVRPRPTVSAGTRRRPPVRPRPSPMADHCAAWLAGRLADGPVTVAVIAAEARHLGWSKALTYRVRDRLGLQTSGGHDRDHPVTWRLPAAD